MSKSRVRSKKAANRRFGGPSKTADFRGFGDVPSRTEGIGGFSGFSGKTLPPKSKPVPTPPPNDALREQQRLITQLEKVLSSSGTLRFHNDPDRERKAVHETLMNNVSIREEGAHSELAPSIGIITAAPVETIATVLAMDSVVHTHKGDSDWSFYVGLLNGAALVVVKCDQGALGAHSSTVSAARLIQDFGVRAVLALGIAWGSTPGRQQLGDVLVSSVVQPYDHSRVVNGQVVLSQPAYSVKGPLAEALSAAVADWNAATRPNRAILGAMVASNTLLDDAKKTGELVDTTSKKLGASHVVIGGEMEMGGILTVASASGVPAACVKSICDFGGLDTAKNKSSQTLAAVNAVQFLSSALLGLDGGSWVRELPKSSLSALSMLSFEAFVKDKSYGFVGRADLFARVHTWRKSRSGAPVMLLRGGPGVGKSAFLSKFASAYSGDVAATHFCRYDSVETLSGRSFLENVVKRLAIWCQNKGISVGTTALEPVLSAANPVPLAFEEFVRRLPRDVSLEEPVLILVDSLDEAHDSGGASGDSILQALSRASVGGTLPWWLKIFATTRNDAGVSAVLAKELDALVMESTSEENLADARAWLALHESRLSTKAIEALLTASEGNFMYLRQAVEDPNIKKTAASGNLPASLSELYSSRAQAHWKTHAEWAMALPALEVLVAAVAPCSLSFVKSLPGGQTALSTLSSVLEVLPSEGTVRVYHKSFADWATRSGWQGTPVEAARGHVALARAGLQGWENGSRSGYEVRFLAFHAISSGDSELVELARSVTLTWPWLKYRGTADGLSTLAADLSSLGGQAKDVEGVVLAWQDGGIEGVADGVSLHLHGVKGLEALVDGARKDSIGVPLSTGTRLVGIDKRFAGATQDIVIVKEITPGVIVTGGSGGEVIVWSEAKGAAMYRLEGHLSKVTALELISEDTLLTGCSNSVVRVWSLSQGLCECVLEGPGPVAGILVDSALVMFAYGRRGVVGYFRSHARSTRWTSRVAFKRDLEENEENWVDSDKWHYHHESGKLFRMGVGPRGRVYDVVTGEEDLWLNYELTNNNAHAVPRVVDPSTDVVHVLSRKNWLVPGLQLPWMSKDDARTVLFVEDRRLAVIDHLGTGVSFLPIDGQGDDFGSIETLTPVKHALRLRSGRTLTVSSDRTMTSWRDEAILPVAKEMSEYPMLGYGFSKLDVMYDGSVVRTGWQRAEVWDGEGRARITVANVEAAGLSCEGRVLVGNKLIALDKKKHGNLSLRLPYRLALKASRLNLVPLSWLLAVLVVATGAAVLVGSIYVFLICMGTFLGFAELIALNDDEQRVGIASECAGTGFFVGLVRVHPSFGSNSEATVVWNVRKGKSRGRSLGIAASPLTSMGGELFLALSRKQKGEDGHKLVVFDAERAAVVTELPVELREPVDDAVWSSQTNIGLLLSRGKVYTCSYRHGELTLDTLATVGKDVAAVLGLTESGTHAVVQSGEREFQVRDCQSWKLAGTVHMEDFILRCGWDPRRQRLFVEHGNRQGFRVYKIRVLK